MNKLKYEQTVAENNKRRVVRSNAANDVKSGTIKSAREKFEKEKRTAGSSRPATAAAAAVGLEKDTGAKTTNGRRDDEAPRDPAVSSVGKSECQLNDHAVTPKKPMVKRAMSAAKFNKTGIPQRQLSQEVIKSSEEIFDVSLKKFVSYPGTTLVSEPEINESGTSSYECHEDVQDSCPNDEPANLKDNKSMENNILEVFNEQLPQVDTNCDSSGEGDKNPDFETNEHVNEDTPHELEISYVTSLDEREPNDDLVSSCLEDESIELLEKPIDPVVTEVSKESPEYSELPPPPLNDVVKVLDSNQEKIESTKSLRARFEALHNDRPDDRPTSKSNRISQRFDNLEIIKCESCDKKVYPLEKVEIENKVYHKTCFRCAHCQCLLRMDSFTSNCHRLYCMPHFKQLFKTKGSYDQGFTDNVGRN